MGSRARDVGLYLARNGFRMLLASAQPDLKAIECAAVFYAEATGRAVASRERPRRQLKNRDAHAENFGYAPPQAVSGQLQT